LEKKRRTKGEENQEKLRIIAIHLKPKVMVGNLFSNHNFMILKFELTCEMGRLGLVSVYENVKKTL